MIVHSNNFNRYLTPFRAEWDPKDLTERLIVCGRSVCRTGDGLYALRIKSGTRPGVCDS